MEVASKSNRHFIKAHKDELQDLPDQPFMYREVDISYSLFRQCTERELLTKVDKKDGRGVWKKNGIDATLNK